jgi:striatin 1/3/4
LERNNSLAAGNQNGPVASQQPSSTLSGDKDKESEVDSRQITAIYRPDDFGEWKEKLRQSHEAAEQARLAKENQTGVHAWESVQDDDDELKDADMDIDDEESSVVGEGEGEGTKVWKAKRTLRKLVI